MSNSDRKLLDVMIERVKLFEFALEECIAQFDYSGDEKWRADFKEMMLYHAKERLKNESKSH